MIRKIYLMFLFFIVSVTIHGQQEKVDKRNNYRFNNYIEMNALVGNQIYGGNVGWSHFHQVLKKHTAFKIGYGVRFHTWFEFEKNYVTAPSQLTKGAGGPMGIFNETITGNLDTLFMTRSQANALNIFFSVQYTFFKRLDVGLNVDIAGWGIGAAQTASYKSSKNIPGAFPEAQDVYPTGFNVQLLGDNNIGSLHHEIFARFWMNNQWALKASLNYTCTEYSTVNPLRLQNHRFRTHDFSGSIGITYCPWRSEIFIRDDR
jgi:hypothetical protein